MRAAGEKFGFRSIQNNFQRAAQMELGAALKYFCLTSCQISGKTILGFISNNLKGPNF
jgi:hypothetical protein